MPRRVARRTAASQWAERLRRPPPGSLERAATSATRRRHGSSSPRWRTRNRRVSPGWALSIGANTALNDTSSPPASTAVSDASDVQPRNRSKATWYTHEHAPASSPNASAVRMDSQHVRRPCSSGWPVPRSVANDKAMVNSARRDASSATVSGARASQAAARRGEARDSQASWITSASSWRVISPRRLARTSTDRCPSKWAVVKNGESGSWTSAALSSSDSTQMTMTSS